MAPFLNFEKMKVALLKYLTDKKPTNVLDIKKWLLNKELIVKGNQSGHNYGPIGSKFKVTNPNFVIPAIGLKPGTNTLAINKNHSFIALIQGGNSIYINDLDIESSFTIKDLSEEIKDLDKTEEEIKKRKARITDTIEFMQANEISEYDEETSIIFEKIKERKKSKKVTVEDWNLAKEIVSELKK